MKTIMFYSYKGGSGRTVAVANVSAALAGLGKRVAVIDLDFEAPGLHHVFGAEGTRQFQKGKGIQHYLKGDIDLRELENQVYVDMFGPDGPLNMFHVPVGALMLYIMASPKVTLVDPREPQVNQRMRRLLGSLHDSQQVDFVILDAASGIRDAYSIASDVSDEMLIFFRWSTQHVEGTLRMVRYMKLLAELGQLSTPFKLVASATPREKELDDKDRDKFAQLKKDTQAKIEQALSECQASPPHIFHDIPEVPWLKWKETVTVFARDEETRYGELARKLLADDAAQQANA